MSANILRVALGLSLGVIVLGALRWRTIGRGLVLQGAMTASLLGALLTGSDKNRILYSLLGLFVALVLLRVTTSSRSVWTNMRVVLFLGGATILAIAGSYLVTLTSVSEGVQDAFLALVVLCAAALLAVALVQTARMLRGSDVK